MSKPIKVLEILIFGMEIDISYPILVLNLLNRIFDVIGVVNISMVNEVQVVQEH